MRLLIVEDEPDLLRGLAQALREDGYAVDEAADGTEGLFKAQAWDYDAIVLDWMLPGLSGPLLLEKLRQEKATPVLFLTARDAVADRVAGLDQGADDYLIKPFDLAEVKARLRSLIRRSHHQPAPDLTVGDVVVKTAAREVYRRGRLVQLTAREYRLVELLVSRKGQVVTRSQIYDHLFDEHHDSASNMVDVYVSRLRSCLGRSFIRTRRGEGYIIDE